MNTLRFMSLGSGSSGNCYYIGTLSQGILIDAGIGIRTLKKRLQEAGLSLEQVWAVFITHDHIDHIKSVGALANKSHIPVYATSEVHRGINRSYVIGDKVSTPYYIVKGETVAIGEFEVTAFSVSHDGSDNVGYSVTYRNRRFTLATDLGYVCENAAEHIRKANYLVIEANYDEQMLETGHYPQYLKNRITSPTGHLSNLAAGQFLASCYQPHLSHIYLCHLSKENNRPELAYATVEQLLITKGIKIGTDVRLVALPRTEASPLFTFEEL